MLHLIFQLTKDNVVLQRIGSGDDVVFLENAVFRVNKGSFLAKEFQQMAHNNIHLYVLQPEIETRGFNSEQLCGEIEVISYSDLVVLTEKNKVIQSWN